MTNITYYSYIILLSLTLLFSTSCKKDKDQKRLSITLYDKPLSIIKSYIQGNWQLHYGKGGICSICIQNYENSYFKFPHGDSIRITTNNVTYTNTAIEWINDSGIYTNKVPTFTMNFKDLRGYPNIYIVKEIANDTLILKSYGADPVSFYFTKAR
ncbi:hypothetical protein [Desertivirga arenae]|uniref:hypothetical protein n=1 Tax=Desertivirga arenae TaxID=2810309 RepID=UPI001A976C6B|nr:hypothetical protein [Pedobacter sp. SYSU D00823]